MVCWFIPPDVATIFDSASRQKNRQDAEIESLKEELNSRDEKISGLKSHILKLETEQPNSKKRCILKDDMNEVMIEDSANKTIEIERLKKENKLLKTKETDQKYQPQIEHQYTVVPQASPFIEQFLAILLLLIIPLKP